MEETVFLQPIDFTLQNCREFQNSLERLSNLLSCDALLSAMSSKIDELDPEFPFTCQEIFVLQYKISSSHLAIFAKANETRENCGVTIVIEDRLTSTTQDQLSKDKELVSGEQPLVQTSSHQILVPVSEANIYTADELNRNEGVVPSDKSKDDARPNPETRSDNTSLGAASDAHHLQSDVEISDHPTALIANEMDERMVSPRLEAGRRPPAPTPCRSCPSASTWWAR